MQFTKRVVCFVLDYGLFIMLSYVYVMNFGKQVGPHAYQVSGFLAFAPLLYWLLYFPIAEGLFGMTLSKFALSIKVVSTTGEVMGLKRALLRRVFDAIDLSFLLIPALISMSKSPTAQRLGDRVADTVTVNSA